MPSGKTANINERLKHLSVHVAQGDDKVHAGDERMTRIEDELAANTIATQRMAERKEDRVEPFEGT